MTDHDHTLQTGIDAVRRGDKSTARAAFRRVLRTDPDNIQALLWLAGVAGTRDEKDRVLQHVLRLDPDNKMAQEGLQALSASNNDSPPTSTPPSARSRRNRTRPAAVPNRSAPRTTAASTPPERETVVLGGANNGGDDNNNKRRSGRRRSLFWLLPVPLLLLLLAGGLWYWQNRGAPDNQATASDPPIAVTDTAVADLGGASPNATDTSTEATGAGYPGPAAAATGIAEGGAPITGTTTINIPGVPIGGGASASPSSDLSPAPGDSPAPSAIAAAPSDSPVPNVAPALPSDTPAPSAVADVPPSAVPTPSDAAVGGSPAPTASPAPTDVPLPTPTVVAAAPAAPAQPAAQPTLLPSQQLLTDGAWRWSSYGLSNVTDGNNFTVSPNGRYLIVLMLVQNTGTTPQQIPDGLYVVTDEQGRTATFNRQASADYYQAYSSTTPGDYSADAAIPPTTTPVTVPLLFDLPLDSTNVVLTSANNPQQGFFVAQRMQ